MIWTWWYILLLLFPSAVLLILMKDAMKSLQSVIRAKSADRIGGSRIDADSSRLR